jgi:hypothetical protein
MVEWTVKGSAVKLGMPSVFASRQKINEMQAAIAALLLEGYEFGCASSA